MRDIRIDFPRPRDSPCKVERAREGSLTLGPREAIRGPAERVPICAQERVLLLHPKPRVLVAHHVHDAFTGVS